MTPVKALTVAILVASSALASTFGYAAILRHAATHSSTQLPTTESWFETPAPRSPELIHRGRILFLNSCAHCHGADARGDEGPDLHELQTSDRYLARTIAHGIPHEMPAFGKKYDLADINALIAYLHALE